MSDLLKVTDQIQSLKKDIAKNLVTLGKILCRVRDEELYLDQCETFNEYLATPEVSIGRATAFKAMKVYEVFVQQFALPDITRYDSDKLYRISGVVDQKNLEEWLGKAECLSRSDLALEVREVRGLPEFDSSRTSKEWVKEFLYEWCPKNKISPADLELEDLLGRYERWRRKN